MEIRALHYFIGVFEEASFTRAAERMHVVQSALSMQVRNLEEELGTPLFERGQRGLTPTVAGRRLYELAVPIARDLSAAKQEILDLVAGDVVTGSLKVGVTSSMCKNVLGKVLDDFLRLYPAVDISVTEGYARNITELVQAGALDLGLGAMPLDSTSLSCELGFTDEFVLVSSQPVNGPTFSHCDLSAMHDLVLVIPSERHLLGSTMQSYIASGRVKARKVIKIDGMVATLESIRHSDWGAICLMNSVADQIDTEQYFIYPISNPRVQFDLFLLHDLRSPPTLAARRFSGMFSRRLREIKEMWSSKFPELDASVRRL
ncbi:LysR family transcriptional regulator [Bordetella hinzii]|uniref:LysR family transcriptional regulator n=1 Tax=Bordetella hinzii TaxID=103855 RepID=A0AAN1VF40_9BORD|nr:LysR family transcriptional regulator [Bordetella hinzii]AKQ58457.1 HTH-type transcriptional regulator CynR [Bordetella hinzii]AZW16228.1 LysR family transcriptional regulator [Bordetella hinzii]MBZ0074524.1 LysR family transcriptional regulator [Bordetella hinzii]MBZ0080470.1 LysR family transcriptional regulator [Bordetella hinzii]MBZ0082869.1 LysR family transcriptional regulator [Bordetella hinzii]